MISIEFKTHEIFTLFRPIINNSESCHFVVNKMGGIDMVLKELIPYCNIMSTNETEKEAAQLLGKLLFETLSGKPYGHVWEDKWNYLSTLKLEYLVLLLKEYPPIKPYKEIDTIVATYLLKYYYKKDFLDYNIILELSQFLDLNGMPFYFSKLICGVLDRKLYLPEDTERFCLLLKDFCKDLDPKQAASFIKEAFDSIEIIGEEWEEEDLVVWAKTFPNTIIN